LPSQVAAADPYRQDGFLPPLHLSDKGLGQFRYLRELTVDDAKGLEKGQKVDASIFKPGDLVSVTGVSKGKGFAGGVKRYHFRGGPKTHGQSDRHRGQSQDRCRKQEARFQPETNRDARADQDNVLRVCAARYQRFPGRVDVRVVVAHEDRFAGLGGA
jgi:hypothetical protein